MWDEEGSDDMESILNELYHHFYLPPELPELKQEIEECREKLAETLDKLNTPPRDGHFNRPSQTP